VVQEVSRAKTNQRDSKSEFNYLPHGQACPTTAAWGTVPCLCGRENVVKFVRDWEAGRQPKTEDFITA
jgi:hypothetical protein